MAYEAWKTTLEGFSAELHCLYMHCRIGLNIYMACLIHFISFYYLIPAYEICTRRRCRKGRSLEGSQCW